MIRSRLGLKALCMCALVLGLMAVWAGAAQAESTGGSWTYITGSGQLKTFEGALAEPEVGSLLDTTVVLHSKALGGTKVLYECGAVTTFQTRLKPNGVVLGKLIFSLCETFLEGVLSKNCVPTLGGVNKGFIETNLIKAQMLLHSGSRILIAEGETANGGAANLATIESTASCALGIKVPVGGKVAILPSNPTTHEEEHLITVFPALTAAWILSNTAEHKAEILGSAWAYLIFGHNEFEWAGLWN